MRVFISLPAILATTSALAGTNCPTESDLATGITFTLASGDTEHYSTSAPGVVTALFTAKGDDFSYRAALARGIYLIETLTLEKGDPDPRSRVTYSYPLKPLDMPLPSPGGFWNVTAVKLEGRQWHNEPQSYAFGAPSQITFGACGYDMIPITITYPAEDASTSDLLHYMPALGLAYLAGSTQDGSTEQYNYISIRSQD